MKAQTAILHSTTPTTVASQGGSRLSRVGILLYGIASYGVGVFGLCWLIATSLGLVSFRGGPLAMSGSDAVLFNLSFIALFGLQHAVMARPSFKKRWTKIIPAAMERSTFVLFTGIIVCSMLFFWQPIEGTLWAVEHTGLAGAIRGLCIAGWAYLFASTFAIDHFQLFGLKQVWSNFTGSKALDPPFVSRLMYRFDRHPIMTGFTIGFWATPVMSVSQFVLAAGFTVYIVLGVAIEERTLVQTHGDSYESYRRAVGALYPLPGRRG